MYSFPGLESDHAIFWSQIRSYLVADGIFVPNELRLCEFDLTSVHAKRIFFAQVCGLPFGKYLADRVNLVGTPDFGVAGCKPGHYCSAIVVRIDDARTRIREFDSAVLAYNETDSLSGYVTPLALAAKHAIDFRHHVRTGSHQRAAQVVAAREADLAAIDAVSMRQMILTECEPAFRQLRVVEFTETRPGPPYVASLSVDRNQMFRAVRSAILQLPAFTRFRLGIRDLVDIPISAYRNLAD